MRREIALTGIGMILAAPMAIAGDLTTEASMLNTTTANTSQGWEVEPIFTVSEIIDSYLPVGILDGIGAFRRNNTSAWILVNHELNPGNGYPYMLRNRTQLRGARVSQLELRRTIENGVATTEIVEARLAYKRVYDRAGNVVNDPSQINETGNGIDGLARFCSSTGIAENTYGFVDNIYITGEETSPPFHPHGGTQWIIDVNGRDMWAAPALGRGSWENVTPISTGDANTTALLMGDDTQGAPLYLYVGQKDAVGDGSFLDRNGLAVGNLYAWKSNTGELTPEDYNGLNNALNGTWVEITVQDQAMAGMAGYDADGYLDSPTAQAEADSLGCFSFSRPEDLATNPLDGTQAVFASTGRGGLFPSDNWGTVYVVDIDVQNLTGSIIVIHDADDLRDSDFGVRSPDNLEWAGDGKIYLQEDRSTSPGSLFGGTSGIEASIWQLDPVTRGITRIAEVDRSVVVPAGATDIGAGDIGNWETSGILDVTDLLPTLPGERLLIGDVQAHGIRDGLIGDNPVLDEGGQLFFLSKIN